MIPESNNIKYAESRSITVAMISYYFYPEYSGSAKQAVTLIKRLSHLNVHSFVIAAQLDKKWPLNEIIDGIEVFRVPINKNSLINFWLGVAKIIWLKRNMIDIIHSQGMNPYHGFFLFFGKILGKPTLGKLTMTKNDLNFSGQGRVIGRLHKWFLKCGDIYIATSSDLERELKNSGLNPNKFRLIPNGVDTNKFYPLLTKLKNTIREELGYKKDDLIILFTGVIDFRKGVDILIQAFKKIADEINNVQLILVGPKNRDDINEQFYKSIIQMVKDFQIDHLINFVGPSNDISKFYQCADIFVLPSRAEGMPNVILEAMASGLVVIGTKISGIVDIIEDGKNGFLINPNNINNLSERILFIEENYDDMQQIVKNALDKINSEYNIDVITSRYYKLYYQLLKVII